jgi:hypothetical protein
MSVEIQARIVCDKCGSSIVGRTQTKTTGLATYSDAKDEAEERRWMFNLRYGTTVHVCNLCADGTPPVQPIEVSAKTHIERRDARRLKTLLRGVQHGGIKVADGVIQEMFPSERLLERFIVEHGLSHEVEPEVKALGVISCAMHHFKLK